MLRIAIKDSSGERIFATEREEILVGSREDADLRVSGAAPNHCILRAESGRVRLLSLAPGGVSVGDRRSGEAMLAPGEGFAVGTTALRILASAGASRLVLEEPVFVPPPKPPDVPLHAAAAESDFAREVRATVARAPWYLISLVAHVLLLLILSLIDSRVAVTERVAHMTAVPAEEQSEPEIPDDTPIDFSGLEEETYRPDEIKIEEPVAGETRKTPSPTEFAEEPLPAEQLGAGGGRPFKLGDPLHYSSLPGGDRAINRADIPGEQGRATDEVKRGLGDGLHQARARLTRESIYVVRGAHDKIEEILDGYDWPYTLVTRDELLLHGCPKARILFVNCNNRPPPALAGKLSEMVKRLLQHGCWVVTSDWSVEPYLTGAFPSIVRVLGPQRSQRDTTVAVAAVAEDPLLTGVFTRGGESAWWLEDSSTMVSVTDKATLLIASEDMRERYGSRVVVFKFPYGDGLVVHLVGHFYQKDGNLHGLVAMHRLINNVIVERVRADHGR